jgi:hypothetical protein
MRGTTIGMLAAFALLLPAAGADKLTAGEIKMAHGIYTAKCAKCHEFYEPKRYSEKEWRSWLLKMNKKAKLKKEQSDLIGRYLDEYRAGRLAGQP